MRLPTDYPITVPAAVRLGLQAAFFGPAVLGLRLVRGKEQSINWR